MKKILRPNKKSSNLHFIYICFLNHGRKILKCLAQETSLKIVKLDLAVIKDLVGMRSNIRSVLLGFRFVNSWLLAKFTA